MRGDTVLVRAFRGEALRRIVWDRRDGKVMILSPEGYESARQQGEARPIGFPAEDVFEFDVNLYERLRKAEARGSRKELGSLWSIAKPYALGSTLHR